MLSNKLTFSLASLVVLLALAFAATSVMADHGGPVPTITEDTSTPQTRAALKLKVSFDVPVTGLATDDFEVKGFASATAATGSTYTGGIGAVTASTKTGEVGRVYTLAIDLTNSNADSDHSDSVIVINLAREAATGSGVSKNGITSEMGTLTISSLPYRIADHQVEISALKGTGATRTVDFTFTDKDGKVLTDTQMTALTFADTYIVLMPTGSATVASVGSAVKNVITATLTLSGGFSTTSVSVAAGYIKLKGAGSNGDGNGDNGDNGGDDQTPSPVTVSAGKGTDTLTLAGSITANGFAVISAADLPDLNAFFVVGGTISLIADAGTGATARTAKDVVISEIMWGLDQAQPVASQANKQFIELYNTTGAAIDLTGAMLSFDRTAVVPAAATGKVHLDQVSNVYLAGWVVDVGQSGRLGAASQTFTPTDLVSMYRNIDYVKVEKTDHNTDAAENRKAQLKDFPDGKKKDSWKESTKYSVVNIKSTPNAKHVVSVKVLTPTAVPYSPVIINEIGNLTGDANDWIELRAVADANLKKHELAYIKDGVETTLVQFPDKDYKLTADEILLIVNKDPRDTPLARGKKFGDANGTTDDVDQENRGVTHDVSMFYDANGSLDKMPEDGKFLLVLRSEAKNNHEKIIDLVGTDFHTDTSAAYRTALFPLQGAAAGHGNVIDGGGDDEFDAPGAYKRNDAKGGTGEKDWGPMGYTGIGYDRSAPKGDASGGTPGFPNDAQKEKGLASDTVTISEVMVNSRGGRYPQWIELRNSSSTNGVNLNGWKLRVENVGQDATVRQRYTLDIPSGHHIPPNRSVLIVTRLTSTRASTIADAQLINLNNPDTKKALEAQNSRFTILSMEGFTLELFEKDQKTTETPVDMVTVTAELLTAENIGTNHQRISLVRAYLDKTPGKMFSAEASVQIANEGSFYGASNDISTPGNYPGSALPVSLSSFRPVRDKATGEVVIRWITQSELNNAGFNILRSETKTGDFQVVNLKGIIPGHGTTSEKHVYTWTDTTAKPNVVYYYQIEDVSLDGNRTTLRTTHLRGNVNAAGKVTTTWGDLKTQN